MTITLITLFPEMFENVLNTSILKRAQEKKKVTFTFVNLRDFGIGPHKSVDDTPYGGGAGMVMRVDVLHQAILSAKKDTSALVILMDPTGTPYSQAAAEKLSTEKNIILICPRYEGVDARIRRYVDMEISMGDFVMTGGEIPAMAVIDSVVRLIPGVLGHDESSMIESFSKKNGKRILEHPHYTRPATYEGEAVPEIILSGDHKKIEEYQSKTAETITSKKRPDLL